MIKIRSKCCKAKYERLFPYYPGKEGSLSGELYCKKCGELCEVEVIMEMEYENGFTEYDDKHRILK